MRFRYYAGMHILWSLGSIGLMAPLWVAKCYHKIDFGRVLYGSDAKGEPTSKRMFTDSRTCLVWRLVSFYVGACLFLELLFVLWVNQESFYLHPLFELAAAERAESCPNLEMIPYGEGRGTIGVQMLQHPNVTSPEAVIIYFHGKGQYASWVQAIMYEVSENSNARVYIPEYNGYGCCQGVAPRPNGLSEDALAAFEYVVDREPELPIVVFGASMGTAPAVSLLSKWNPHCGRIEGIILENPWTSLPQVVVALSRDGILLVQQTIAIIIMICLKILTLLIDLFGWVHRLFISDYDLMQLYWNLNGNLLDAPGLVVMLDWERALEVSLLLIMRSSYNSLQIVKWTAADDGPLPPLLLLSSRQDKLVSTELHDTLYDAYDVGSGQKCKFPMDIGHEGAMRYPGVQDAIAAFVGGRGNCQSGSVVVPPPSPSPPPPPACEAA